VALRLSILHFNFINNYSLLSPVERLLLPVERTISPVRMTDWSNVLSCPP
jgi:hypothetical protein